MGILWVGPLQWSTCMYFPLKMMNSRIQKDLRAIYEGCQSSNLKRGDTWDTLAPCGILIHQMGRFWTDLVFLNWIYIYIIYTYIYIYIFVYLFIFLMATKFLSKKKNHSKHPQTWQLCPLAFVSFCNGKKTTTRMTSEKNSSSFGVPLEKQLWRIFLCGVLAVGWWDGELK